jgi:hypothetical protein
MSKKFHIGDLLSITTGKLVSPRHMEGIYDILNFMTSDNLFTHQLPRACEECKPFLLEQMPWLSEITAEKVNSDNWESWLAKMVEKYGESHEIKPIPTNSHKKINPLTELQKMTSAKIIPVIIKE